jgi:hypothetical protein
VKYYVRGSNHCATDEREVAGSRPARLGFVNWAYVELARGRMDEREHPVFRLEGFNNTVWFQVPSVRDCYIGNPELVFLHLT